MIPGVAAHLWQSTVFAGAAWIVALAMRENRAQVRYWVWFTASAKFLIPFSWLMGLGRLLPRPVAASHMRTEWVAAVQQFSVSHGGGLCWGRGGRGAPRLPCRCGSSFVDLRIRGSGYLLAASVEARSEAAELGARGERCDRSADSRARDVRS